MKTTLRYFWLCAAMTFINALTSAGFSIAALFEMGDSHMNAMYGVSRSVTLALVAIVTVVFRNHAGLMTVSLIMVLIQTGDALIGGINHDLIKTAGPAFLAIITLASLWLFAKSNFKR